jgi:hypothetical protein
MCELRDCGEYGAEAQFFKNDQPYDSPWERSSQDIGGLSEARRNSNRRSTGRATRGGEGLSCSDPQRICVQTTRLPVPSECHQAAMAFSVLSPNRPTGSTAKYLALVAKVSLLVR